MAPVAYMFSRKGRINLSLREGATFEDLWEAAVEGGAEDVNLAESNESDIEVCSL
jgi:translational activator of cytochrome c oxidase 1